MLNNPTPAQAAAVSSRKDTIVSAAAGSGKTTVMVERAAQLVLSGTDVTRIALLTFTEAAAAQMKQRIRKRLAEALNDSQRSISRQELREQINRLATATMGTLHSFCIKVVRRYFNVTGTDPMFAVMGDIQGRLIKSGVAEELTNTLFEKSEPEFLGMMDELFGGDERKLVEAVEKIYDFAFATADPYGYLEKACQPMTEKEYEDYADNLRREICDYVLPLLAEARQGLIQAAEGCAEKDCEKLRALSDSYGMLIENCMGAESIDNFFQAIKSYTFQPHYRISAIKGLNSEMYYHAKSFIDEAKEKLGSYMKEPIAEYGAKVCKRQDERTDGHLKTLCSVVAEYARIFGEKKRAARLIDFHDAEHLALKALRDDAVSREIRASYDYVFIDEYQDTNNIQDEIISRIAAPDSLFCVGDVKQSIYGFRHANPELFMGKYYEYASDSGRACIDMNDNFRSSPSLIAGINQIFSRCMSEKLGGVYYNETQKLRAGRQKRGSDARPCLSAVITDFEDEYDKTRAEAKRCAQIIKNLIGEEFYDEKEKRERRFEYRDIAILLRSVSGVNKESGMSTGDTFVSMLREEGIPAVGSFEAAGKIEGIEPILAILRVIDNGMDDYSVLGAMRSVAGGFCARELAQIRLASGSEMFRDAVRKYAQKGEDEVLRDKVRAFISLIDKWRTDALLKSTEELIHTITDEAGIRAAYAASPHGQSLSRIDMLCLTAREYDAAGTGGGLWGFLQIADELTFLDGGASARDTDKAVRIMTVHGSKGLEFPVVILAGAGRKFNAKDETENIVKDGKMGIGARRFDVDFQVRSESARRRRIAKRIAQTSRSGELRVLYVALTRAMERLYVVAAVKMKEWEKSSICYPEEAVSALSFILPSIKNQTLWDIKWDENTPQASPVTEGKEETGDKGEETQFANVDKLIEKKYPFMDDARLPSKISVSSLARHFDESGLKKPRFMLSFAPTAAERGTLVHEALLLCDLNRMNTPDDVEKELDMLCNKGYFTTEERRMIDDSILAKFAQSKMAERIRKSPKVLREQPFNLLVSAKEAGYQGVGKVMVQGVIDCAFIEDGKWVLVDYKTDRMPEGGLQELADRYQKQLSVYRQALCEITGIEVKETYICALSINADIML